MTRKAVAESAADDRVAEGAGDIHALLMGIEEEMESTLRARFAHVERALAQRLAERLSAADALIARLTEENTRLKEENERATERLARMRELAMGGA